MTDLRLYRAWIRASTRLTTAMNVLDSVSFLEMDPEMREECKVIWDKMDDLKKEVDSKIGEIEEKGIEGEE